MRAARNLQRNRSMIGELVTKPPARPQQATLGRALQRFVDATQCLAGDRTNLLKVDAADEVREGVRSLPRVVAPELLLAAGWLLLVAALVTWLSRHAPPEVVLAAVGGGHALIGLVLAVRRDRQNS